MKQEYSIELLEEHENVNLYSNKLVVSYRYEEK